MMCRYGESFLISNKEYVIGAKVRRQESNKNIFNKLCAEHLLCEKLVDVEFEKIVGCNGSIDVESVESLSLEHDVYRFVYTLREDKGCLFIQSELNADEYMYLIVELINNDMLLDIRTREFILEESLEEKIQYISNYDDLVKKILILMQKGMGISMKLLILFDKYVPKDCALKESLMNMSCSQIKNNYLLTDFMNCENRNDILRIVKKYDSSMCLRIEKLVANNYDVLPF